MKYLFFDIECSVVSKNAAKICAFGYCLTDEQFHISEKEDLLINPLGGFHLTDRKGTQGIVLPYEYEDFKKHPTFPALAPRIYKLLEDEDTLVCGHATMNDVKYLNLESKRFSLPSFRFSFADTQFLYMNKIGAFDRQFGLGTIAEALGVRFTQHRAADDAYATMRIAEAMCVSEGLSLPELLKKYKITLGRIEHYEVTQSTSVALEVYREKAAKEKEEREKARARFHAFADRQMRVREKEGALKNKRVCFSYSLEEREGVSKPLLTAAFKAGASYSFRAENCDYYICFEGEKGARLHTAAEHGATLLTAEDFSTFLGI